MSSQVLLVVILCVSVKAKDTYHARCFELEKLKRESANQKDWERAEIRMKRARAFMFLCCCDMHYFLQC